MLSRLIYPKLMISLVQEFFIWRILTEIKCPEKIIHFIIHFLTNVETNVKQNGAKVVWGEIDDEKNFMM